MLLLLQDYSLYFYPLFRDSDEEIFSDLEDEDDSGSREKQNKLNEEVKRKLTIDEFPMFIAKRAKTFESYR